VAAIEAGTALPVPQPGGRYDSYPLREHVAMLRARGGRLASLRDFLRQFF